MIDGIAALSTWEHLVLGGMVAYGLALGAFAFFRPCLAPITLVLVLPLLTVEVGVGVVERTLSTDKIALVAVVAAWLTRRWRAALGSWRVIPARLWAAFLLIVAASALSNGPKLDEAWALAEQLIYAVVFVMGLDALATGEAVERTVVAAAVSGVAVAGLALVEGVLLWGGRPIWLTFRQGTISDQWVAGSTIGHVNFLGAYLVLLLPLLIMAAARPDGAYRIGASIGVVVMLVALAYTRSLGAWGGLMTALAVLHLSTDAGRGWRRRALVWGVLIVVAALGLLVLMWTARSTSLVTRLVTYRLSAAAVAERPLLGHGAHAFPRESLRLEQAVFGQPQTRVHPGGDPLSAHGTFADVAVERGLLGLSVFLALLGAVFGAGARAVGAGQRGRAAGVSGPIVAGLAGFTVHALTENVFGYSKIAVVVWVLAAALVKLARRPDVNPLRVSEQDVRTGP